MTTNIKFKSTRQAEVDSIIDRARQMQGEYFAQLVRAGLFKIRGVLPQKNSNAATA